MKKTFANLVQKSLVAALLVMGALLFGTSRAEAQGGAKDLAVTWKDVSEAKNTLVNEVVVKVNPDPLVTSVGSDAYIRAHYFKSVYNRIDGGEPIEYAIIAALGTTQSATDVANGIPGVNLNQSQATALLNYTIALLKA
ncbi:MAG: hypothetical protein ACKVU2_02075 [Saprospiraceae bacterium]